MVECLVTTAEDVVVDGVPDVAARIAEDVFLDNHRLFTIIGEVTSDALTLTGGYTNDDNERGATITSDGANVTLTNSTVTGNATVGMRLWSRAVFAGQHQCPPTSDPMAAPMISCLYQLSSTGPCVPQGIPTSDMALDQTHTIAYNSPNIVECSSAQSIAVV